MFQLTLYTQCVEHLSRLEFSTLIEGGPLVLNQFIATHSVTLYAHVHMHVCVQYICILHVTSTGGGCCCLYVKTHSQ